MKLLSPGSTNTKINKGARHQAGFLPFILHLAPERLSGYNVCPNASKGCAAACLNTAGRGVFSNVQNARIRKTKAFFEDRNQFLLDLMHDLSSAIRKAKREGLQCVVRLNGTSDIAWELVKVQDGLTLFDLYPEIQFYDYTKSLKRALRSVESPEPPVLFRWPKNYHLTFSRSETNDSSALRALNSGVSVAVVFKNVPDTWLDRPTIPGDDHDFRFLDPRGVIVALTAKGKAKRDQTGFVVRT